MFPKLRRLLPKSRIKLEDITKGFIYMILSCICYSLLNSALKYLGHDLPPLLLVFYRSLFTVLILLPFIIASYQADFKQLIRKKLLLPNLIRGCFSFVGTCFWFIAISNMNITECVALSFTTPLFIMLFAIIILKEKASTKTWCALIIGFIASFIIKTPDLNKFSQYSIFVLIAAALWAAGALVVKKFVVAYAHPVAVVFFTSLITALLSTPIMVSYFTPLTTFQFMLLVLIGILVSAAQIFMALAYRTSPLNVVTPVDFSRLIFTAIFSYFIFDEVMTLRTIIGASLICLSSSYLLITKSK